MPRGHSIMSDRDDLRMRCSSAAMAACCSRSAIARQATPSEPFDRPDPRRQDRRRHRAIPGSRATWRSAATGSPRSVALGPDAAARRVIDARGLVVAPGFIDMHSHSDMTLLEDGDAQSKIRQGVTTEVLGEDTSAGPAKGKRAGADRQRTAARRSPGRRSAATSTRSSARASPSTSPATSGWAPCWTACRATRSPGPTRAQLEAMKELLDEAMRDGALGLSTMLASPRELAVTTDDIVELCQRGQAPRRHLLVAHPQRGDRGLRRGQGGHRDRPARRRSRSTSST